MKRQQVPPGEALNTSVVLKLQRELPRDKRGWINLRRLVRTDFVNQVGEEALAVADQAAVPAEVPSFVGSFRIFELDTDGHIFPYTAVLLGGLANVLGMELKHAQFNYFEPGVFLSGHRDEFEGETLTTIVTNVVERGDFMITRDKKLDYNRGARLRMRPGDGVAMPPIEFEGAFTTREHLAANPYSELRISLVAGFAAIDPTVSDGAELPR